MNCAVFSLKEKFFTKEQTLISYETDPSLGHILFRDVEGIYAGVMFGYITNGYTP